jgi:hypothetical protein
MMHMPRHQRAAHEPDLENGRRRAEPARDEPAGARSVLGNAQLASLLGAPAPAHALVVQREGITAATLDEAVRAKGWTEIFNWLNGQPMSFILSWLLSLSSAQFAALLDNTTEMTGNRPRTGIAVDAVSEARKGQPSQATLDYYEHRFDLLKQETLPDDQRDWIRGMFGVGPNAGKVAAAPGGQAAAKPAPPPTSVGDEAGAAKAGGGGASTSSFGKGQIDDKGVGTKLPDVADEVAKKLFAKDTFKELVQSYRSINVFGRQTFVAEEFGNALLKADAEARPKIEAKEGRAFSDKDWKVGSISGYQANKGGGLHPWGVAVDFDYAQNPYIANEAGDVVKGVNVVDRITTPIYHRIALLMLDTPRMSLVPGGGKLTYDALAAESQAMIDYFSMRDDEAKVKAWVDKRKDVLDAAMWQAVFNGEEVPADQRASRLTAVITDDYTNLSAGPKDKAPTELPGNVDRPFDPKGGAAKGRDPAKGFLTIRKEIVEALRAQPHMRWGGTDFGAGVNGDIMHFDFGKKYNVKATAAKIKADKKAEEEGTTPVQKLADPTAGSRGRLFVQRHEEGDDDHVEEEILNPPALQRSAIPGAAVPRRPTGRGQAVWAETVSQVQRLAGNKAAEAAATRLDVDGRGIEDLVRPPDGTAGGARSIGERREREDDGR